MIGNLNWCYLCAAIFEILDMKYNPAARLQRYVSNLQSKGRCSYAELVEVVRQTRLLVEKGKLSRSYPTVAMYCNWIQHVELDRNQTGHAVLAAVDRILADNWVGETAVINEGVRGVLNLPALRSEFTQLFKANGISTVLFDVYENWKNFVHALVDDLLDRPITFPADVATNRSAHGFKKFGEMVAYRRSKGISQDSAVTKLYLSRIADDVVSEPGAVYWHLRVRTDSPEHYADLAGIVAITEPRSAFLA